MKLENIGFYVFTRHLYDVVNKDVVTAPIRTIVFIGRQSKNVI